MKNYEEITKEAFEYFITNPYKRDLIGKKAGWAWVLFKIPFDENAQIDLIYLSHKNLYNYSYYNHKLNYY